MLIIMVEYINNIMDMYYFKTAIMMWAIAIAMIVDILIITLATVLVGYLLLTLYNISKEDETDKSKCEED